MSAHRRPAPRTPSASVVLFAEPLEPRRLLAATLLKDVNPTPVGSLPSEFVEFAGAVYFAATGPQGRELYRSRGAGAGATLVKDAYPGPNGSNPRHLTVVGNSLYFTAFTPDPIGTELWKSDGTAAGTVAVADIYPGDGSSDPDLLTEFKGTLYFTASDAQHPRALWKSDGTATGTSLVSDAAGEVPSNITDIEVVGDTLYVASSVSG